jgi:ABC-2 type transport system ATP-binding protein
MSAMNDLLIRTDKLTKAYSGIPVLRSLDLKVPRYSIFGFLGPNGAGKTTAIKLILGLIRPTGGSCTVFGMDLVRNSIAIRRHIGYLAQDPRYYEGMTARETLRFTAGFFYEGTNEGIEARVEETLKLVSLEDIADRSIRGFSGGERQRLGIAQAWVNHPELLILDEPAASLDPMGRRDVLELMNRIRGKTTIFYSTHILEDVQRVSDVVAILNKGELIAQAPIEELLSLEAGLAYRLVVRGDAERVRAVLLEQPWITSVEMAASAETTAMTVGVTDADKAEEGLLRAALGVENIRISNFGCVKMSLEDAFVSLVEGERNAG